MSDDVTNAFINRNWEPERRFGSKQYRLFLQALEGDSIALAKLRRVHSRAVVMISIQEEYIKTVSELLRATLVATKFIQGQIGQKSFTAKVRPDLLYDAMVKSLITHLCINVARSPDEKRYRGTGRLRGPSAFHCHTRCNNGTYQSAECEINTTLERMKCLAFAREKCSTKG